MRARVRRPRCAAAAAIAASALTFSSVVVPGPPSPLSSFGASAEAAFAPLPLHRLRHRPAAVVIATTTTLLSRLRSSPDPPGDSDLSVRDSDSSEKDSTSPQNTAFLASGLGLGGVDNSEDSNRPMSGIASGAFVPPADPDDLRLPMQPSRLRPPPLRWDVYVCQSKACRERGSGATLDAFVGLAPPPDAYGAVVVTVHPAVLSRAKGKGPIVRCIVRPREPSSSDGGGGVDDAVANEKSDRKYGAKGKGADDEIRAFEVQNVDSVDKVYRILTKHMDIEGIDAAAAECLKHNYKGNAHLERGELSEAIKAYDRALATGHAPQEGVILLMRATAYLKRAFRHQVELKGVVSDLAEAVPVRGSVEALYDTARRNPALAVPAFKRVTSECRAQDGQFRRIKYRHGLYEFALLHAARDALRSTQLLPTYAKTWLRAGDALAELRKLRESARYYERAMELDPTLEDTLGPVIERLERSQEFLDRARANGWSEDTLRLALDVAG